MGAAENSRRIQAPIESDLARARPSHARVVNMGRNARIGRTRIETSHGRRRRGAVGVAAAVAVAVAAVFALGLELGRRKEPAEPQRPADPLALLDGAERIAPPAPAPAKLVFHDVLTAKDRSQDVLLPAPKPAPARQVAARKAPAATTTEPAAGSGASQVAARAVPAPDDRTPPATAASTTPAAEAAPRSGWEIQLVASPNEAEAKRIAVKHAGARVVTADVDGKRWYRVRLVGFASRPEAQAALERLGRDGVHAFVTAAR
jgi:cell division protein FtsN